MVDFHIYMFKCNSAKESVADFSLFVFSKAPINNRSRSWRGRKLEFHAKVAGPGERLRSLAKNLLDVVVSQK